VVAGSFSTLELAPVLLAAERMPAGSVSLRNGGIRNLHGEGLAGFAAAGHADVATNASTQILSASLQHPDLRTILTVAEGHYRIVARASQGRTLAELRGKRFATVGGTSAAFYLHKMLRTAGLTEKDIVVVPRISPADMGRALVDGRVDAIAVWEPMAENALRALGSEAVSIDVPGVYYEWFNLHTTEAALNDPVQRRRVVAFVREVIAASAAIRSDPVRAQQLVSERSGHALADIAPAWRHHVYPGSLGAGLVDVMVEEEAWLAGLANRPVRSREEVARLVDRSVLAEAMQTPAP
jgi:NitT/TauT family transport system substrate-binding protein